MLLGSRVIFGEGSSATVFDTRTRAMAGTRAIAGLVGRRRGEKSGVRVAI